MSNHFKNLFYYLGTDEDGFERVSPRVNDANRIMVAVFSGLGALVTFTVFLLSFVLENASPNRLVYAIGSIASLTVFILVKVFGKHYFWLVTILVQVIFAIFYMYGIFIGTITNPEQQTVTFMVMLVLLPVLFIDRPIRMFVNSFVYTLIFIVLALLHKTGSILATDIMDAVIYSTMGFISGVIVDRIKIQNYLLTSKLEEISRLDQLTQMNNRNSFELDLDVLPSSCRRSMLCIYIDVNGLHELNNEFGHEKGDEMLKFVANQIKNSFGEEYSYRVGGDEFVVLLPDFDEKEAKRRLFEMAEIIQQASYHVAVGMAVHQKYRLSMSGLVKAAEGEMYHDKKRYYKDSARDRRKRDN